MAFKLIWIILVCLLIFTRQAHSKEEEKSDENVDDSATVDEEANEKIEVSSNAKSLIFTNNTDEFWHLKNISDESLILNFYNKTTQQAVSVLYDFKSKTGTLNKHEYNYCES